MGNIESQQYYKSISDLMLDRDEIINVRRRRSFNSAQFADDEILDGGQRNKILNVRAAAVGSFSQTDRRELSQRADRQCQTALDGLDASDESR